MRLFSLGCIVIFMWSCLVGKALNYPVSRILCGMQLNFIGPHIHGIANFDVTIIVYVYFV